MPEICRFLGIIITMYYGDHDPAHFHVRYNDFRAVFSIQDLRLLEGSLPPKVTALVLEWAFEHRPELMDNWKHLISHEPLDRIKPLV